MFKIRFIQESYSKNRDWKPFISQILTNVQEIFLVMWMLTVPTPLDHMYVHATLDTREMENLAGVILKIFFNPSYLKRRVIQNSFLTQIMVSEVVKHLS